MASIALDRAHYPSQMRRALDVNFHLERTGPEAFNGQIGVNDLGRIKVAQIAISAHRTRRLETSQGSSQLLFNRQVSGNLILYQDGRAAEIGPGDMYIFNPSRDFELITEDVVVNIIAVDAALIHSVFPEVDCYAAVRLRDEGAASLFSSVIDSLVKWAPTLDAAARGHLNDAIPHLMAAALSSNDNGGKACPSRLHLLHKERIKAFAREHLRDPDLSCAMIASSTRLSQRYVYDIMADEPLTLMRWIRKERLARCSRELSSAVLRHRSISEIAYSWGFVELAHFSRAFSAEFGMSPRAYRQARIGAAT